MTPETHANLVAVVAVAIAKRQGYELSTLYPGPRLNIERDARSAVDALLPHLPEPDKNWDAAVEWLLNSGHVDSDAADTFWMLSQGHCTEDEADRGVLDDGRTIREARAMHRSGSTQ